MAKPRQRFMKICGIREEIVGAVRYFAAKQAQVRLSRSISVPMVQGVNAGQFVEIRQAGKPLLYQIEQAQHMRGDDRRTRDAHTSNCHWQRFRWRRRRDGMAEFDLTAEITSALKSWSGDIADGLDELVDEEAKALKQDIVNDSPERTGDYKKAGKIDKKELGRGNTRAIVYNATNFQRTHLLEKGHAGAEWRYVPGIRI